MAQTPDKYEYPTGQDPFQPHRDIKKLAESITGIVPVANREEADAIVAAYQPTKDRPLYVDRADIGLMERHDGTNWLQFDLRDSGWQPVVFGSFHKEGPGFPARVRRFGKVVQVEGVIRRSDDSNYAAGNLYEPYRIPSDFAPSTDRHFITAISGGEPIGYARIILQSDGYAKVAVSRASPWIDIGGSWVVD